METARRLAARATRFALTYRAGSDTGLFALFVASACVGSLSPVIWLACGVLGMLLVARVCATDRAGRAEREANRERAEAELAAYRATYSPSYSPTFYSFSQT